MTAQTAPGAAAPPLTMPPLTVTLFGPMQVLVEGRPLPRLRSRKALWLLALLALRAGRPVQREWLAGTLWPDADQGRAAMNLRVVLSELRHALGAQGGRLQSPARHSLSLDLAGADVDVDEFDAALGRKRATGDEAALARAVALYRGPLLEGCNEEWAGQERAVREQGCLQALQTLGDAALAAGDFPLASDRYRRAAGLDPWREAAQRGLMEALSQGGEGNAALDVYQAFVRLLRRDDPRAAPDAATTALYARLRGGARRRAAPPAPTAPEDAAVPTVTGYLPHPLTDLVGREDEREEVVERLRRSRLVTLTGPGGIGKTRLALAVAAGAAPDHADGVWLVALDALSEGAQVSAQVARVLGVKEEAGRALRDGLTDHLRARRLLLVLDNCEHLLEASAGMAAHLLRECAGLRVLATSREALGITGEVAWALPPLAVPDPAHLPTAPATLLRVLAGYEGVRLFVERAQGVQKAFALTRENALPVAQVCARLEGIPLAIELAATRIRSLTVAQIAARLDDHLALLTGGNRTAQSRQQTLRATLDWSYGLLSVPEQLLLERVAVFSGGWTLGAAEAVCSGEGMGEGIEPRAVLDLLTSLVDKSLVIFKDAAVFKDGTDLGTDLGADGGRYRLLEMVRQYAAGRRGKGGAANRLQARHRDFFLGLAEEAEPHLWEADQWAWLRHLEAERDNLRTALAWCEEDAPGAEAEAEAGLRLAGALWLVWSTHGDFSEGRAHLHRALARPGAQGVTAARGWALKWAGKLADGQGDYASARVLHEQGLGVFRELGDTKGIASALGDLNDLAHRQGDAAAARAFYQESRALYERSLGLFREAGDKKGMAHEISHLGILTYNQGDYAAARALYEQSLDLHRELGDATGVVMALNNLGEVAHYQGDHVSARAFYEECLDLYRERGAKQGVARQVSNLGFLAYHQGDHAAARALYEQSLDLYRELGDRKSVVSTLNALALVAGGQGDHALARAFRGEEILLCKELGDRAGSAQGLEGMAAVLLAQGDTRRAVRLWGAAQSLREGIGAPLPPDEQERYDREVSQARQALGAAGFDAAWGEGRAMTWEQATTHVPGGE